MLRPFPEMLADTFVIERCSGFGIHKDYRNDVFLAGLCNFAKVDIIMRMIKTLGGSHPFALRLMIFNRGWGWWQMRLLPEGV